MRYRAGGVCRCRIGRCTDEQPMPHSRVLLTSEVSQVMSHHEKRELAATERQLRRDDPDFANHFTNRSPARLCRLARPITLTVAVAAALCPLLDFTISSAVVIEGGLILATIRPGWSTARPRRQ